MASKVLVVRESHAGAEMDGASCSRARGGVCSGDDGGVVAMAVIFDVCTVLPFRHNEDL